MKKNEIFFHIATIGNYQEVFDEIYYEINKSSLIDKIDKITICIVGKEKVRIPEDKKISIIKNKSIELGEFFTLDILKKYCDSINDEKSILYLHTKGVSTPYNKCIVDWRRYMTFFVVNKFEYCLKILKEKDACGVDLVNEPTLHFSGNFWWANSKYIKLLPDIKSIIKSDNALTKRHNAEFWIGMNNGNLLSLWNSNINVYERHLHSYPQYLYI